MRRLNAPAERQTVDSPIAATAPAHDLIIATQNTADLADCGVRLVDSWQPRQPRG